MSEKKETIFEDDNGHVVTFEISEDSKLNIKVWSEDRVVSTLTFERPEKASALLAGLAKSLGKLISVFVKSADPRTDPLLVSIREFEKDPNDYFDKRPTGTPMDHGMSTLDSTMLSWKRKLSKAASLTPEEESRRLEYTSKASCGYVGTDSEGDPYETTLRGLSLQENATESEIEETIWDRDTKEFLFDYAEAWVEWKFLDGKKG
jgi:hypothetical protein